MKKYIGIDIGSTNAKIVIKIENTMINAIN